MTEYPDSGILYFDADIEVSVWTEGKLAGAKVEKLKHIAVRCLTKKWQGKGKKR